MSSERGLLVVLAGPSGAGKTTLARHLEAGGRSFRFSVSTTTRPPRGGEVDGSDYDFVDDAEFTRRVEAGYFLEWAVVHGHRYGTSRAQVEQSLGNGRNIVLDIDVQGAMNVRQRMPGAILVFVMPPDMGALSSRLSGRGTESADLVGARLAAAVEEIRWAGCFDYTLANGSLPETFGAIDDIVSAEAVRSRPSPYTGDPVFEPEALKGGEFWMGRRVVVTAGPTRECMDDVRFLSNRSSGLMGCELARAFMESGARVDLLLGPCCSPPPAGASVSRFESAAELEALAGEHVRGADLLAMCAAVSDFRPVHRIGGKIAREDAAGSIEIEVVPDILAGLGAACPVLAFSLEAGPGAEERARRKMSSKRASAIFLNRADMPGVGMESAANEGALLFPDGSSVQVGRGSKRYVAACIAAALGRRLAGR